MALITNTDEAIQELYEALDPERLGRELLEETGKAAVEYDSQPAGGWRSRTGELADSYSYEVETGTDTVILTEMNDAEHAEHVENRQGISVLTAFDSGRIIDMLNDAFKRQDKDRVL